jgi:hypothetical protein
LHPRLRPGQVTLELRLQQVAQLELQFVARFDRRVGQRRQLQA